MMSTQSPVHLVWKFVCQLCISVLSLSTYHNLSDPNKVNPGQRISQIVSNFVFAHGYITDFENFKNGGKAARKMF